MTPVPFNHLTLDRVREFLHADHPGLVLGKMSVEEKQELGALSSFGLFQDDSDYRMHLDPITRGGRKAEYDPTNVRRGMENLGLAAELDTPSHPRGKPDE